MYEIPTSIYIDGMEYKIRNNGDFRVILDCFQALGDIELTAKERLLAALIIFYEDFLTIDDLIAKENLEILISKMFEFFNCGSDNVGTQSTRKLLDWQQDEQLICSAVNRVANKEIRLEPYIHWWTFMGYFTAIGDAPISTIIHIRDKIINGKKLEKHEQEYRRNNPQYFTWNSKTVEENEADKLVRELWDNGG